MSTLPRVSVLIPTLNRAQLLDETLESVRAQDYCNLEIIVSDNGSQDMTSRVIDKHCNDPRVRRRRNQSTIDMMSHWNQCLWEASGDFVFLISDDDLMSTNLISEHVGLFQSDPDVVVTLPRVKVINLEGAVTREPKPVSWIQRGGEEFLLDWLWGRGHNPTVAFASSMMRSEDARTLGGWPHFPTGANADNALFFAVAVGGKIAFGKDSCFFYRVGSQSMGCRTNFRELAESSRAFRYYLREPKIQKRLAQHPKPIQKALVDGVHHMLARQFFYRLEPVVSGRLNEAIGGGGAAQRKSNYGGLQNEQASAIRQALSGLSNAEVFGALGEYTWDIESFKSFSHYAKRTAHRWTRDKLQSTRMRLDSKIKRA